MRVLRTTRARRASGDDGVTLILFALAIAAMMVVVAMAIDLSNVRNSRQSNKSIADVSAAAGMRGLANGANGAPQPWGGVCKALDYLKLNHASGGTIAGTYKDGTGAPVSNPCNPSSPLFSAPCVVGDPSTWAWFDGSADGGDLEIDIKSAYAMPDPDFTEDAASYAADNAASGTLGACGQLAVILRKADPAFFGGVVGADGYETLIRSVGRVTAGEQSPSPVALLLLEQTACRALYTSGNNTFVLVKKSVVTTDNPIPKPGFIQVNSTGAGCSGGSRVIEGGPSCGALTSCSAAGPSIVAETSSDGKPGVIGNHALGGSFAAFANSASCPTPSAPTAGCTIGPTPTDRGIVTRAPVDNRYLTRVTSLKARAQAALAGAPADASYYQVNGVGGCNNLQNKRISATAVGAGVVNTGGRTKVYLNCSFDTGSNNVTIFDSTITDVVVSGRVDVGSGGTLRLDGVQRFYIGGASGTAVNDAGTLWVNGGSVPDECTNRRTNAPTAVTEMVVMSGSVITSGGNPTIRLCNTFLFLADGSLPATPGTAPANQAYGGGIDFGSQTVLDWTAPNQTEALVDSTNSVYDKFEDLALWTESGNCANTNSPPTRIGGQGTVTAIGVFFLPNACFNIQGGGSGALIVADAQFVVRILEVSGTTALTMAPNIANVVPVPFFESFRLVR